MANYIHGTSAAADYEIEEPRKRQQPKQHQAKKNRTKSRVSVVDLPYLVILSVAGIAALSICCNFLKVQSSVTTSLKNIEVYEAKLEALKNENDALESSINTSINLDHVYNVATKELGMVYAHKDQVITYERSESEYVRQNGDIPQ